jgi:hypothetical protein
VRRIGAAPQPKEKTMTFRSTAVLAMTLAGLAATGAQAQVRTEPASGVFVWEALGATPSIQLRKMGSGAAASGVAQAPAAKVQAPASPAASNAILNDAPGSTPQFKRPGSVIVPPATPQGAR